MISYMVLSIILFFLWNFDDLFCESKHFYTSVSNCYKDAV